MSRLSFPSSLSRSSIPARFKVPVLKCSDEGLPNFNIIVYRCDNTNLQSSCPFIIAFKCGKRALLRRKIYGLLQAKFLQLFYKIKTTFFISGQYMLYNLHTQKNKWNNLTNSNIKSMNLDKASSIWIGQFNIKKCKVTHKIIQKKEKGACKHLVC